MIENNFGDQADAFYSLLMNAHDGLDETDSHALNARLVLLLANEIGDHATLSKLITLAGVVGALPENNGIASTNDKPSTTK